MDLRVRSAGWRTVAEVMLLAALVTGCIPLPVPVPEVNPRYSTAQLDVVGREATTAVSIRAELGPPDLTRDDGRIWIYTWHKVSGMFIDVPIWTDEPASPGGEIVSKQYLLVLEFDADGNLQGKELAQEAPHSGHRPYCTGSGLCVAGEVSTSDETFGVVRVFEDQSSFVTARGQARERLTRLEPEADQCLLTVWPSDEWGQLKNAGRSGDERPDALLLMVEGAAHWSRWQAVPMGTYARMVLPAGPRLVSVRDPRWNADSEDAGTLDESTTEPASAAMIRCGAGDRVYLAIGPTMQADRGFPGAPGNAIKGFPIVLRKVEATAGQSTIATMPQVLPPE